MCFNKKFVYNKYTKQSVLVSCGHCEACLQEKANRRKLRLLNHVPEGYDIFFFHLTYADEYCPYIYLEDLVPNPCEPLFVSIYRQKKARMYYNRKQKRNLTLFEYGEHEISEFIYDKLEMEEINKLHPIHKMKNHVAVLNYKDVQDFFKRIRSRANRNKNVKAYLEKSPLYYFCTGEYGEDRSRCHWHILLYVPRMPKGFEWWKRTVVSCWSYARSWLTRKNFEYAISPEKYVAQYVNCSVHVSPFLLRGKIRPSWHYSHGFGYFNPAFQLGFILDKIRQKKIDYTQVFPLKGGRLFSVTLPIPTYITNRFFPKFKGLWKIPFYELPLLVKHYNVWQFAQRLDVDVDEAKQIHNSILSAYLRYKRITSRSLDDYIIDFINYLKARFLSQIRQQLEVTIERDILQSYDNLKVVHDCNPKLFKSFFNEKWFDSPFIVNPNQYDANNNRTIELINNYQMFVKQKQFTVCLKN